MQNLVLTRIDDRLIHGQVMTAWIKNRKADQVVIVDDGTANDEYMIEVLEMAIPGIDSVSCIETLLYFFKRFRVKFASCLAVNAVSKECVSRVLTKSFLSNGKTCVLS